MASTGIGSGMYVLGAAGALLALVGTVILALDRPRLLVKAHRSRGSP